MTKTAIKQDTTGDVVAQSFEVLRTGLSGSISNGCVMVVASSVKRQALSGLVSDTLISWYSAFRCPDLLVCSWRSPVGSWTFNFLPSPVIYAVF